MDNTIIIGNTPLIDQTGLWGGLGLPFAVQLYDGVFQIRNIHSSSFNQTTRPRKLYKKKQFSSCIYLPYTKCTRDTDHLNLRRYTLLHDLTQVLSHVHSTHYTYMYGSWFHKDATCNMKLMIIILYLKSTVSST